MNEIGKSLEEYDQFLSVSGSVGALMKYMAFECVRAIKCKIGLKKLNISHAHAPYVVLQVSNKHTDFSSHSHRLLVPYLRFRPHPNMQK